MTGILQYLMQQMLPPDFVASPIFHVPISKAAPTELKHLQETARYILIHGVSFSTVAGGALETIRINNVIYLSYLPSPNISGTHMIPHVFEGGTCKVVISDANLIGTIHYQFIKTRV